MKYEEILEKIAILEFHQQLLLKLLPANNLEFYRLIIEKSLTKREVERILLTCDRLSKEMEEQKVEGFIHFQHLYEEFLEVLQPKLKAEEVISACLNQGMFPPLMAEFAKYTGR